MQGRALRHALPNPGVQPRAKRVGCNDVLGSALSNVSLKPTDGRELSCPESGRDYVPADGGAPWLNTGLRRAAVLVAVGDAAALAARAAPVDEPPDSAKATRTRSISLLGARVVPGAAAKTSCTESGCPHVGLEQRPMKGSARRAVI